MLQRTFLHVPTVGEKREAALWAAGFTDWARFLRDHPAGKFKDRVSPWLEPEAAAASLPRAHAWRLFPDYRDRILFLDIETTGLRGGEDEVTCIGTYDGRTVRAFIRGRDIEAFEEVLDAADLLVTYNGACFDVPFLKTAFPSLNLDRPKHIDLRYPLRRLGFRGGLKRIEPQLGVTRNESVAGVDGYMAVLLWHEHLRGHPRALDTLVRYCLEDVVNLEPLLIETFNRMTDGLPIAVPRLPAVPAPEIPWTADTDLVRDILSRSAIGAGIASDETSFSSPWKRQ